MTDERAFSIRPATSLFVSVLLHVGVVILLVGTIAGTAAPTGIEHAADHDQPPPDDAEVLGIDESRADTLTWVGYQEYEEHLAQLSEVEQAAMLAAPSAGGGGSPTGSSAAASAPPSPPPLPGAARPSASAPAATVPTTPTEDPERQIAPTIRNEPRTSPTEAPTESDPRTPTEATTSEPTPSDSPRTKPAPETTPRETEETPAEKPNDTESDATPEETPDEEPAETPQPRPGPEPSPEPTPGKEPTPTPSPAPGDSPSEEPSDAPGSGPAPPTPEPGNDADKDAEASSMVDTPPANWRNGKPLAAQGLEIKTRRLTIPLLTWKTLRPTSVPVVEIDFQSDGKPKRARLEVSSGDAKFDEYLMDALYRWRASGKRLKELKRDETALVRLRLLLD
ncbi:MAG: hypothetical protein CMJ51_04815 [Planctomycetaceae bacterium]|nr:hypothetical protein [Planctomycetaceae bacterium]